MARGKKLKERRSSGYRWTGQFWFSLSPSQRYREQEDGAKCPVTSLLFLCTYTLTAHPEKVEAPALWSGPRNGKFPSTFVPNLCKKILNPLSYCRLDRLRIHSLQF